jgi:DNA-binding CsgD family transcriptional regulator
VGGTDPHEPVRTAGPDGPPATPTGTSPLTGDDTAAYALVDEQWRLQFLLPRARAWGFEEDRALGSSILGGLDPADLPALIDAGDRVRRGDAVRVTVRVHHRTTDGSGALVPIACEIARTDTLPHGWLALTSRTAPAGPADGAVGSPERDVPVHPRTVAAIARIAERSGLTPREVDIVELLVEGYRVTTMSRTLHLTTGTIRNYLSGVFHKVGVHGQADLIEYVRHEIDRA